MSSSVNDPTPSNVPTMLLAVTDIYYCSNRIWWLPQRRSSVKGHISSHAPLNCRASWRDDMSPGMKIDSWKNILSSPKYYPSTAKYEACFKNRFRETPLEFVVNSFSPHSRYKHKCLFRLHMFISDHLFLGFPKLLLLGLYSSTCFRYLLSSILPHFSSSIFCTYLLYCWQRIPSGTGLCLLLGV